MSWEAASFVILSLVLLGGFAWYERSRPTSQVVALVAALAALAVAGRVAFAALPNVVATTDIVIFAGFALGPAPGFAVGGLAGLVSNFWLGQGPWTPWQMAGWGLCGVLGAALAVVRPRAGRLTLALVCGLAGLAYGALLNFSLMATYGGELSAQRFLALEARALPFDAAHAIGNATLALVAGPAMVRMLVRFRERFEWRRPSVAAALLLVALSFAAAIPGQAQGAGAASATRWLLGAQNADGGWGASPEDDSSTSITCWAMLGLEATGRNPLDVSRGGRTPVDFLRGNAGELSSSGDFARTIVALKGAGVDPRSFGGRNLVSALLKRRRDNGSYEGWPGSTAFAVIALRAAGATGSLEESISWLTKVQNRDGGWGDVPDSPSTADGTGAVMQAIPGTSAAGKGLSYLRKAQRPNGGFGLGGSGGVNAQSTAWAVQGMLAVDANPDAGLDYLAARQADDGHYAYSASSDQTPVWVTGQVLVPVAGDSFPISAPARNQPSLPAPASASPSPSTSPAPSLPAPSSGAAVPQSSQDLLKSLREQQQGSGTGSGSSGPGSGDQGSSSGPPASAFPLPGQTPESSTAAPATTPFAVSESPSPSFWAALGIGLASGGLALGSVLFLGRRYGW